MTTENVSIAAQEYDPTWAIRTSAAPPVAEPARIAAANRKGHAAIGDAAPSPPPNEAATGASSGVTFREP
ncbi:hypothetical protein ACN6LK_002619 [Streptomyces griseus]|uniref:hypothetical protein n=1 Tax=Streptomyces griseus TaxID=1911 RepID=UPI00403CBD5C